MYVRRAGLGLKINLALLAFMIVLGAAMAGLIFFGFRRTQHNATAESREGLEQQGREALLEQAQMNSLVGQFIVNQAVNKGREAALYLGYLPESGVNTHWDSTRLAQASGGQRYDQFPRRITDVWIPASAPLDEAMEDDLADSSVLDALFPAVFQQTSGIISGNDTIAMYFLSTRGMIRKFPPRGVVNQLPAELPASLISDVLRAGPEQNPRRETVWSAPFADPRGRRILITAYTPVYSGTEYRGVIGVDLSLTSLVQRADDIDATPNGYAFILDPEGNLLPGASYEAVNAAMSDEDNAQVARAVADMRAGSAGVARAEIGGEDVFVAYAPLDLIGGSLALVSPVSDLTVLAAAVTEAIDSEGNRTLLVILLTMAGFFTLALIAGAWLNRMFLFQPIAALARGTRAVATGDLDTQISVSSRDELGDLAVAFNIMTDEIRAQRTALRSEIAERERAQSELNAVVAAMTDAVMVVGRDGRYLRAAPTLPTRHPAMRARQAFLIGKTLHDIIETPQADMLLDTLGQALDSGTTANAEYSVMIDGERRWYFAAISPLNDDSVVWVARDVTERVNARQLLEQRVQERTSELSALIEISRSIASTLELRPLLAVILDQLKVVTDYTGCSILVQEDDELLIVDSKGPRPPGQSVAMGMRLPITGLQDFWDSARHGQVVNVDDVSGESPGARTFQSVMTALPDAGAFNFVRSLLIVPLGWRDNVIGMLTLSKDRPGYFTEQHERLAAGVATQAAVAIENARLYERAEARTRELSALLDVSRTVASTIDLRELVRVILDQTQEIVDYTGASLMTIEGDDMVIMSSRGRDGEDREDEIVGLRFPKDNVPGFLEAIQYGDTYIIDDVRGETPAAKKYRAAVGERIDDRAFSYIRSWMGVPVMLQDRVIGMLSVSSHVPGYLNGSHARLVRAMANQAAVAIENARLFEQAQARTRELAALLDVSTAAASTLEPRRLITVMLEQMRSIVDFSGASLLLREGDALTLVDARPDDAPERPPIQFSLESVQPLWDATLRDEPTIIDDVRSDEPLAVGYRGAVGDLLDTALRHVRSFLAVPLVLQDRILGMLTAASSEPGFFTADHARITRAIADQMAVALENARLFAETQARARETEALIRADEELFRTLNLNAVCQALVDVAVDVLGIEKSLVTTFDSEGQYDVIRASRNISDASLERLSRFSGTTPGSNGAGGLEPIVVEDLSTRTGSIAQTLAAEDMVSVAAVPIRSESGLHGRFVAAYTHSHRFSPEERRLLLALADRAAGAIENAALYEKAQQVASLEERQRLARELHDSVSQALYGIALGARTARTLLSRDPAKAAEPVDYVLSLAEAGLAEMRALIFELRPESLESEGLVAALEKQVAATRARYGITVDAALGNEPDLPIDVKEALYRIAQEALHNTIKHARASRIELRLEHDGSGILLVVSDDGAGFDAQASYPGHMGLHSMRERAARVGVSIEIESAPGRGTRIKLRSPLPV